MKECGSWNIPPTQPFWAPGAYAIELAADPVTGAVWAASDAPKQGLLRLAP